MPSFLRALDRLDRRQRPNKKRWTLREAVESLSSVHVALGVGGVALGLGALGLTLGALRLRRRREMEAMDTTMLIRAFASARESERANIATFCVSRVHELRQLLSAPTFFPTYQSGVRDILKRILVVVQAKKESPSRTAQIAFLESALNGSEDAADRVRSERIIPAEMISNRSNDPGPNDDGFHATYGHVSTWDVRVVESTEAWFDGRERPGVDNADFSFWDTRRVVTMNRMFYGRVAFNGEIGTWDTRNVTDMGEMLSFAKEFDGDIGGWNTCDLENTSEMFRGASKFNRDIGNWSTASVSNMSDMFAHASSFNQDISRWKVGAVTRTSGMFRDAAKFCFGKQVAIAWNMDAARALAAGLVLDPHAQFGSRRYV